MIREKLLDKATELGLKIYQDSFGKWIIEDIETDKNWFLRETELERWTMVSNGIPGINLDAKLAFRILEGLVKKSR
ncbi:MAG: hypothetical protein QNJ41_17890 [Xenococcaceae cyanobacterium MO_188.B32]|nr:hypothetical protein [Xenococcaceae cyanobacterium MO_188.B32]